MKIVYFYDAIARLGGIEKIWVNKMNCLAEQYNIDIYLITTSQGNHPIAFPLSGKVTHIDLSIRNHTKYQHSLPKRIYIGWRMDKELKKKLHDVINRINPDIIIAAPNYAADIACNLNCKSKKIIESHGAKIHTGINNGIKQNFILQSLKKIVFYKYFKTIEKKADMVVALTKGDANDWHTDKKTVIPNIVQMHNTTYSTLENKTVLFAGRFSQEKGLEKMLEAWKIVVSKRNDWTLRLVGEGLEKEQLIKQCEELGIIDNVIFAETTPNIEKEYLNSSIFLLTSKHEGFGLVLVEAMQCGVPCISFNCPYGPAAIIDNGINGYLINNRDTVAFANAVLKLINDDELRMKMGKAAIEKSKQYFPENIMPQWINLFNKLTNAK